MPKERRIRSASFEGKSRASPFSSGNQIYPYSSRNGAESLTSSTNDVKEWEDARCPVCMEYPHNAVLLHCSSRENGCRPFMCDTSYRHSNCLDQFRKAFYAKRDDSDGSQNSSNLLCPLCRGDVSSWDVVSPARKYMNAKVRSCSLETCSFTGTYRELRKHARTEHPSVRPTDTDPEREQDWRRMEWQQDIRDLMSTLQSAIGGSRRTTGLDGFIEEEDAIVTSAYPFQPVAFYFSVRVRIPSSRSMEQSSRVQTRSSSRRRRQRGTNLWGETLNGQEPGNRASQINTDDHSSSNNVERTAAYSAPDEASGSYQRGQQGRTHQQLIILSDDDHDDDDDNIL